MKILLTKMALVSLVGVGAVSFKEVGTDCFPFGECSSRVECDNSIKKSQNFPHTSVLQLISEMVDNTGNNIDIGSGSLVVYKKIVISPGNYRYLALTAEHCLHSYNPNMRVYVKIPKERKGTYDCGGLFKKIEATIVEKNVDIDIAVISFEFNEVLRVTELYSYPIYAGEEVDSISFPLSIGLTKTQGLLSFIGVKGNWVCTADIMPGSSGGGVFLRNKNNLIGITVSVITHRGYRDIGNTSLPISWLHSFVPTGKIIPWLFEKGLTP